MISIGCYALKIHQIIFFHLCACLEVVFEFEQIVTCFASLRTKLILAPLAISHEFDPQ